MKISHGWICPQSLQEANTIASKVRESPYKILYNSEDMDRNNEGKEVTCVTCQLSYIGEHECKVHTESHGNSPVHFCASCGLEFSAEVDLEYHAQTAHERAILQHTESHHRSEM